ncbi:MAG: hypothetical protein CMJ18_23620 [Phycisphaeraceae bacterium]|nr:hypothetical protein [Phycisphaeraceae bacterium]
MRRNLIWAVVLLLAAPGVTRAAPRGLPFIGITVKDAVVLRSGAGNFYVSARVGKGTLLRVEQVIQGWYKVVPPEGSYSMITRAHVDAEGDGSVGIVNRTPAKVLALNLDNPGNSYRTQIRLTKTNRVEIIDSYGGFYKIRPPTGAFLYCPASRVRRATREEIRRDGEKDVETIVAKVNEVAAESEPERKRPDRVEPAPKKAKSDPRPGITKVAVTTPEGTGTVAKVNVAPAPVVAEAAAAKVEQKPPSEAPNEAPSVVTTEAKPAMPEVEMAVALPVEPQPGERAPDAAAPALDEAPIAGVAPPVETITPEPEPEPEPMTSETVVAERPADPAPQVVVPVEPTDDAARPVDDPEAQVEYAVEFPVERVFVAKPEPQSAPQTRRVEPDPPVVVVKPVEPAPTEPVMILPPPPAIERAAAPLEADLDGGPVALPASALSSFEDVEAAYERCGRLPLERQPIRDLLDRYRRLEADAALSADQRQVVARRLATLERRARLAELLRDVSTAQQQQRSQAESARRARLKVSPVGHPAGRLVSSTLYDGDSLPRLYRLIDPATEHTIMYVRPDDVIDPRVCLGRRVVLRGAARWDDHHQLWIWQPSGISLTQ